jgi:hypothetical protein
MQNTSGVQAVIASFPAAATIPAHGYFLLENAQAVGLPPADWTYSEGFPSVAGSLGLKRPDASLADALAWQSSLGGISGPFIEGNPAVAPATGSSLSRKVDGLDTNDNSMDFFGTGTPTPSAPN